MNVLVLGGTGFLGPQIVAPLLAGKHRVTLFNRGRTNAGLFPEAEKLHGDRATGDLKALDERRWDAVIDVFASQPKWVRATCERLAGRVGTYAFVSTISVFDDFSNPGMTEDAPTFPVDEKLDAEDRVSNENYGPMKVRSEALVREHFPRTATIVRPGLIVGPDDPTDRFTYWPARVDRGGTVLAPGNGRPAVQFVDARDLGAFVVKLVEDGHAGTYNATGPAAALSMAEFLHGCRAATGAAVRFEWVEEAWLLAQGARPFADLPLWAPGAGMAGFMKVDCARARAHGLAFRPLAETARDTIAWAKARPVDYQWRAGWTPAREAEVLAAWGKRVPSPRTPGEG